MAIDFTKPATSDNYSTAFVPNIQANQTALAQWLDSTNTTITGTPPTYSKRYNRISGLIEEYGGAAWAALPLLGATSVVAVSDLFGFDASLKTSAGLGGFRVRDQAGTRKIEFLFLGSTAATTYGATAGNSVLNFNAGTFTISMGDAAKVTVDASGNVGITTGLVGLGTSAPIDLLTFGVATGGQGIAFGAVGGNYANIWTPYLASGLVLATGLIADVAADAYKSSYGGGAIGRNAIRMDLAGGISFFSDTATTVTRGTAITPTLRSRLLPSGEWGFNCVPTGGVAWRAQSPGNNDTGLEWSRLGAASGLISSYNRSGSAWTSLSYGALDHGWAISGTTKMTLDANGVLTVTGAAATLPNAIGNSGTAFTLNCRLSNVQSLTMTGNVLAAGWTISNPGDGQTINLFITQDATGSRTLAWPASFKWPGGTAGVVSTAANAVDFLVLTYRAANTTWYAALNKAFA